MYPSDPPRCSRVASLLLMTLATRCGVLCSLPWPPRVAAAMSSYLLTERGRCHNTSHDQICGQWRPIASPRFIHIVVVVGSSGKAGRGDQCAWEAVVCESPGACSSQTCETPGLRRLAHGACEEPRPLRPREPAASSCVGAPWWRVSESPWKRMSPC
jgi:hypothetical protein